MSVRYCPACAALAKNFRIIGADDDKAVKDLGEKPDPEAERPDDGRHFRLAPKAPSGLESEPAI